MPETTVQNTNHEVVESTPQSVAVQEETRRHENVVSPAVDIYEVPNALIVKADLPGLRTEDISVNVEQNVLTISGKAPRQEAEYTYREFEIPGYYRQFKLGEKIDQNNIQAEYTNGVLTLHLAFAESAKPRQIKVNVG